MFRKFVTHLLCFAVLWASSAYADEANELYIFKQDGEMPRVEASGVDRLGAAVVHQFLGEDFIVFEGSRDDLSASAVNPVQPIPLPEDNDDPVLPICQCPEDYTAALSRRMEDPALAALLFHRQTILTPKGLPSLQPDQVEQLERFIRNEGTVILREY
jgi:hypothetical protein